MLWLTKDISIRLLARTAGRTWVRCCSGRTVRNSESLHGLRCTLQERRGRGKARALLGPLAVRTYRTGVKALSCQSRADDRTGTKALSGLSRADERTRTKALSGQSRADERTGRKALSGQSRADERTRAKALSGQSRADESEGFVVSKPCGRADGSEGFVGSKPSGRADESEGFVGSKLCGRERRLCRVKAVRTGQKAEAKMGVILALRR